MFDPVLEEDLVESWAVNELQVEERCSELEERGLVECFGVGISNHVLGADLDWDGEEREELFTADVHPAFEVSVSSSGSDVGDGGDCSHGVAEDLDGVLEGDAEVLEELDDELEVFGASGVYSVFGFG